MANIIKIKRGLSKNLSQANLQEGEMAFTTDTKKLYISNTDEPINNDTTYSLSKSGSTITLTGSDGSTTSVTDADTNTTYNAATTSANGLMTSAMVTKLNGIAEGANKYSLPTASASTLGGVKVGTNLTISSGVLSAKDTTYSAATTSAAGLMSAADKTKLDGIAEGANKYTYTLPTASSTLGGVKTTSTVTSTSGLTACPIISGVPYYKDTNTTYTLPNATSSTLGGVKIGSNITISSGTISLTKDNVTAALGYTPPTTNTTYSAVTTSANGLMIASDKSKLDGIASGATKNTASSTTPKANGTAAVGSESNYARGDHVHPLQTSVSGNAGTATKLATARSIGKASFDGSGSIYLSSIMGRASLSGSGTSNKTKWTKFATVNVSDAAWSGCDGLLHFFDAEAATPVGLLNFHIRSGSAITSASIKLRWLTLISTGHTNSVVAVKTADGIYDLYFSPQGDYISMKVTLIDCFEPNKITLHSSQGYVASVTATATSTMDGCVYGANILINTRNIKLTGDATGSATFNGSADASIATTLANSGVTAGSYGPTANVTGTNGTTINVPQITVDAKGRVTSVVNRVYTSKDTDTNTTYSAATTSANGLMTSAMVTKLNGIATGANAYTLPNATSSVLGGVKVGSNITVSSGTISLTKANVTSALGYTPPTTNTTYSVATTSANGLMSSSDKTKLDGIATGAQVNNVVVSTSTPTASTAQVWINPNGQSALDAVSVVGEYAEYRLTAHQSVSQAATWGDIFVPFSTGSFTTSNSSMFSASGNGIKCNFTGRVMVCANIGTGQTGKELDLEIYNSNGSPSQRNTINISQGTVNSTHVFAVNSGAVITTGFNSNSLSFTIYKDSTLILVRIK